MDCVNTPHLGQQDSANDEPPPNVAFILDYSISKPYTTLTVFLPLVEVNANAHDRRDEPANLENAIVNGRRPVDITPQHHSSLAFLVRQPEYHALKPTHMDRKGRGSGGGHRQSPEGGFYDTYRPPRTGRSAEQPGKRALGPV